MWSISDNISGWEGSYSRWYENTGIEHRLLLEWGQKDYNVLNSGNNVSYMLLAQDALNDYNLCTIILLLIVMRQEVLSMKKH